MYPFKPSFNCLTFNFDSDRYITPEEWIKLYYHHDDCVIGETQSFVVKFKMNCHQELLKYTQFLPHLIPQHTESISGKYECKEDLNGMSYVNKYFLSFLTETPYLDWFAMYKCTKPTDEMWKTDYMNIINNILIQIRSMHKQGMSYGDIKEDHIMCHNSKYTLIDMETLSVPSILINIFNDNADQITKYKIHYGIWRCSIASTMYGLYTFIGDLMALLYLVIKKLNLYEEISVLTMCENEHYEIYNKSDAVDIVSAFTTFNKYFNNIVSKLDGVVKTYINIVNDGRLTWTSEHSDITVIDDLLSITVIKVNSLKSDIIL